MTTEREPDVPRLPRGRGFKLTGPQVVKIVMVATLLVFVIVMQRPCADAVSNFITSFDEQPDAGAVKPVPPPEGIDPYQGDYVEIKPGMTDQEIKEMVERERAKATRSGTGTGTGTGVGTGTGTGSAP